MRPLLLLSSAACFAVGCGPASRIWLPPPDEQAATLVIESIVDDAAAEYRVVEVQGGAPTLELAVDRKTDLSLEVFAYRATPDALGLVPGRFESAEGRLTRPLPEPESAFIMRYSEEESSGWVSTPTVSSALARVRLEEPCPAFEVESRPVTIGDLLDIARLDEERAVIVTIEGRIHTASKEGVLDELVVSGLLEGEVLRAVTTIDDTIWVAGRSHNLWRGQLEGNRLALESVTSSAPSGDVAHLAVGRDGSGEEEVFGLTQEGIFFRYHRGEVTSIYDFPTPPRGFLSSRAGVVWLGPEEAISVYESSGHAAHVRRGVLTLEEVSAQGLSTIGQMADGTLIAAGVAFVSRRTKDGQWNRLEGSPLSVIARSVAPFADGFVYGGGDGYLSQYVGGHFCEPFIVRGNAVEHIVDFGDRLLLSGDNYQEGGTTNSLEVLTQAPDE